MDIRTKVLNHVEQSDKFINDTTLLNAAIKDNVHVISSCDDLKSETIYCLKSE